MRWTDVWKEATLNANAEIYSKQNEQTRKEKMNPLSIIYWTRFLLGIVAALICTLFIGLLGDISIFNGISIALLVYIISYYIYKRFFMAQVEKPSKIFSTGVGAYFLTWIVMFTLFFTLLGPTLTLTSPASNTVFSAGEAVTISASITNQFGASFSGANVTANSPTNALIQLVETSPGTYSATYNTSSDSPGDWNIRVAAWVSGRYREDSITVRIEAGS